MERPLSRRQFLRGAGLTAASMLLPGCNRHGRRTVSGGKNLPNLLFIFDDQLRADACGVYGGGNITTPNIDRLASQGMLFTNGISTCPLCTPYRGMLQTGRYPTHSGLVLNRVEANPDQTCIAHVFADAGYRTGFIGKWHLSAGLLKTAGKYAINHDKVTAYAKENPETEFTPPGPRRLGYQHWQASNFDWEFNNYWYYADKPAKLYSDEYETDAQTTQAIEFMSRQKEQGRPFFLMIAPHPPHPPFKPSECPAGYLDKIPQNLHWSPNVPQDHPRRKNPLEMRCYYAMCKNMDDNLGRILAFLEESGLSDNTIVVFTADHGDQHGSHNRINKMVPYNESVNIPLIVRWPGRIAAGSESATLYTPIDHMATLCGLAELDIPQTCDGVNLAPELLGKCKVNRGPALMMNYSSHWDYFQTQTRWPEWRGVRTEQYTYAKWLDGKEELYDNIQDPYQMNNLAHDDESGPLLEQMQHELQRLLRQAHDDFRPGTGYADWYDDQRNLIRTALGPI